MEILAIWRKNSLELPTKENMIIALDLIESMLFIDEEKALTVMSTKEAKREERLVAALKVVHNIDTGPEPLFYAHTLVATVIIEKYKAWKWEEEHTLIDLAELFSRQWLEK